MQWPVSHLETLRDNQCLPKLAERLRTGVAVTTAYSGMGAPEMALKELEQVMRQRSMLAANSQGIRFLECCDIKASAVKVLKDISRWLHREKPNTDNGKGANKESSSSDGFDGKGGNGESSDGIVASDFEASQAVKVEGDAAEREINDAQSSQTLNVKRGNAWLLFLSTNSIQPCFERFPGVWSVGVGIAWQILICVCHAASSATHLKARVDQM